MLAHENAGIDFSGTDWSWMESWVFIGILAALYVVFWFMDREGKNELIRPGGRPMEEGPYKYMCAVAGALLFAGSLADGGEKAWPGLVAGAVVGFIGYLALGRLFMRATHRLLAAGDNGTILGLGRDLFVTALVVLSVLLDPVGYVLLVVAIVLIVITRGRQDEKYEGLRILR